MTATFPKFDRHPDELYHGLENPHGVPFQILMTARSDKKSGGSGREERVTIALRFGMGRVFHTTLGHVWPGEAATRRSLADPRLAYLLASGAEWAATGACTVQPAAFGLKPDPGRARPHDPWVFRTVLDEMPRIVVAALHDRMWVAWDARRCAPYRAWAGDVRLLGAVHDAVHGPQPLSRGVPYALVSREARAVVKTRGGGERPLKWRGYRIEGENVWFEYGLPRSSVVVEECPRFEGGTTLTRTIRVKGLAEGEVGLLPGFDGGTVEATNGETVVRNVFRLGGDEE